MAKRKALGKGLSALIPDADRLENGEDQFFQWVEGHYDQKVWRGIDASIADICSMPGLGSWWKTRSHWFSDQFQQFMDEKIAEGRAPALYGRSAP